MIIFEVNDCSTTNGTWFQAKNEVEKFIHSHRWGTLWTADRRTCQTANLRIGGGPGGFPTSLSSNLYISIRIDYWRRWIELIDHSNSPGRKRKEYWRFDDDSIPQISEAWGSSWWTGRRGWQEVNGWCWAGARPARRPMNMSSCQQCCNQPWFVIWPWRGRCPQAWPIGRHIWLRLCAWRNSPKLSKCCRMKKINKRRGVRRRIQIPNLESKFKVAVSFGGVKFQSNISRPTSTGLHYAYQRPWHWHLYVGRRPQNPRHMFSLPLGLRANSSQIWARRLWFRSGARCNGMFG